MIPSATLDKLGTLIEGFEGFSETPYLDPAGIPTIGFGSIWDWRDRPRSRVTMETPPVTREVATEWMGKELLGIEVTLQTLVNVPLTPEMHAALLSFAYNLGTGNLRMSTLLRKLNQADYAGAAEEFPRWCMAGGRPLAGLVRRREAERDLFLS